MKKVIFGIFAHPDDEAFGLAGTLLSEKSAGSEVHLICATAGENGTNPDNIPNLGEIRLKEWREAGQLIGADSMHHLGYEDGTLANQFYMEIAAKIETIVLQTTKDRADIDTIEFMSLDLGGLTGHLDHIFMSRVAAYVFYTLKPNDQRFSRLRLACLNSDDNPLPNIDWLYMDAGRSHDEISETVDASVHREKIDQIMRAHHSQRGDYQTVVDKRGERIGVNYFIDLT